MELEPNSLDWNGNELEHEVELKDMKCTIIFLLTDRRLLGHATGLNGFIYLSRFKRPFLNLPVL